MNADLTSSVQQVAEAMASELGGVLPGHFVKERPDGDFLMFEFLVPSDMHYKALTRVNGSLPDDHCFKDRLAVVVRRERPKNVLLMPETALLQRELSASLTVGRNTFGPNFLDRYTQTVTDLEKQIVVHANHMVYGRRGSGKSSLLAYAMHRLKQKSEAFAWIPMQAYSSRKDATVIATIVSDVVLEATSTLGKTADLSAMESALMALGELDDPTVSLDRVGKLVPRIRRVFSQAIKENSKLTIFLDDLHLLYQPLQPVLLGILYSIARDNRIFIKASGIEQLINLWDGSSRTGMESPHDIQTLRLDHNLTAPDQSRDHIVNILDRHAKFCGLPGIGYLAESELFDRLVLSAAAVPRDALSLFSKAIGRSILKKQKVVSVTSLNAAASEAIEEKLKDIDRDMPNSDRDRVRPMLEKVKRFCMRDQRKNAFLLKIANADPDYVDVQRLMALRFVHLLSDGITPFEAGVRYIALMLDYGFYIGIRAARSVELFPKEPKQLTAKDLRKLPIFVASKFS